MLSPVGNKLQIFHKGKAFAIGVRVTGLPWFGGKLVLGYS